MVTPKSDILTVSPHVSYKYDLLPNYVNLTTSYNLGDALFSPSRRQIAIRNIENDPETHTVSVKLRSCRFSDENNLDVHKFYSYSACSVQCRLRQQLKVCNCTNHFMPNTPIEKHCNIDGLKCLNNNYEDLTVVIPHWSHGRRGVVCQDCLPSCTEVDVSVVHDSREKYLIDQLKQFYLYLLILIINPCSRIQYDFDHPVAQVEISAITLPTERYKRNVVRGRLDLVGKCRGL